MSDDSSPKITQLLTTFESFIKLIEDHEWPRTSKIEDIKTAFKLGNYVEKTTEHFRTQNSLDKFLNVFEKWLGMKERTKVYSTDIYAVACDEILIAFFNCPNIPENSLDIAVRVYTSMFSKQRFEGVLSRCLLNAGNMEALSDHIKTTFNDGDARDLIYHSKLKNWDSSLQKGEMNSVREEIQDMLTPYNIETFFHILIGILSLSGASSGEKMVQSIVLNSVLAKMSERTILTKQLWTTMFKTIEANKICSICIHFQDFLNSFLNFIIYIGSMMQKVARFWKSDPDICSYPDITYEDICSSVCKLYGVNDCIKQIVITRLNEAKEYAGTDIWDQILSEC